LLLCLCLQLFRRLLPCDLLLLLPDPETLGCLCYL